jgi:uncharacterized repeat protein (TIGR01451 family)
MFTKALATRLTCFLFILLTSLISASLNAQIISTVAGGNFGDNKMATTIGLSNVPALAVDKSDNVYFLDKASLRIRKISSATGLVSPVAGGGFEYLGNGSPFDIYVTNVQSLACDSDGNLYIGDIKRILKLDVAAGTLSWIAGQGIGFSGDNGPALQAGFERISSIAIDNLNNIYVYDDRRIRKINASDQTIKTIAGTGAQGYSGDNAPAVNAQISVGKLTADFAGNVYFVQDKTAIRKIDASSGIVSTISGSSFSDSSIQENIPAITARFASIEAITVDQQGSIYLTDWNRIRKISASTGLVNTLAGTGATGEPGDGGPASLARFSTPALLAVSPNGNLYFEDISNSKQLRKIDLSTLIVSRLAGNRATGIAEIPGPKSDAQLFLNSSYFVMDTAKNMFITDRANHKIYKIDAITNYVSVIAGTGVAAENVDNGMLASLARIHSPTGICLDENGNIYFVENNNYIRKIDVQTGLISKFAGNGGRGYTGDGGPAVNATLNSPFQITTDKTGDLYIADHFNHVIRKVSATTGIITRFIGNGTQGYTGDGGPASAASLNMPHNLFFDKNGHLYFTELLNNVVRKVNTATGIISTVAGNGTSGNSGDNGLATGAQLFSPSGLVVDSSGNIFLSTASAVRKVDASSGIITTYAGTATQYGYWGDGMPPLIARLNNPGTLQMDGDGNLFVLDRENHRIRKITPALPSDYQAFVYGKVFYDNNSDGVQNPGEQPANGISISSRTAGIEIRTFTKDGIFKILADTGIYQTSALLLDFYSADTITSTFTASKKTDSIVIALRPIPDRNDLQVNLFTETQARPGFKTKYAIQYQNSGTKTAQDVKLFFIKSSRIAIDSTQPAYTSVIGDTILWNLNNVGIDISASVKIFATVAAPPVVNANDTIFSSAFVSQQSMDIHPKNDTSYLRERVTGSFDPNDKAEMHGGLLSPQQLASGEYLQYIIRFQNTGNDTAFNVTVTDTLDSNLDFTSLEMVGASHDYTLSITNVNKLKWTFENILLPDSGRNEQKSHGFIAFRIKPKSVLAIGDKIENTAHIYFDFNLPVITNTVSTVVKNLAPSPLKPELNMSDNKYCITLGEQKLQLVNNTNYKAVVWLGTQALSVDADNQFGFSPNQLSAGIHTLRIVYTNESGENSLNTVLFIQNAVVPEMVASVNKSTLISDQDISIVTATPKSNAGSSPLYSFAKDRGFTSIIRGENSSNSASITGAQLSMGDNWIYIRMKSSEKCSVPAYVLDSVKVTKTFTTTSVIDLDNPGVIINNYPNPANRELYISGFSATKQYSLQVYDSKGVLTQTFRVRNTHMKTISVGHWQNGTYWIRIIDLQKNRVLGSLKVLKQ